MNNDEDYRIHIKVKNNNILAKIEGLGYKSVAQFCRDYDLKPTDIGPYINMHPTIYSPRTGKLKVIPQKLMDIFGCELYELFNDRQAFGVESNTHVLYCAEVEMEQLIGGRQVDLIEHVAQVERVEAVNKALATLTPREERVIRGRMNGELLEELCESEDVTKERIRQIEARALRKLSHPSRKLHPLVDGEKRKRCTTKYSQNFSTGFNK